MNKNMKRVKFGIDPTGKTIHLGRTVPLLQLKRMQELGDTIVLIIGDFTAMIGDASDKSSKRPKLTKEDVAPLYEQKYWRPCYCEVLPRGLDFVVFSMGVNAGPGRSVKLLQSAIGILPDGIIGPRTRALISSSNGADIVAKFSEVRREYYKSLKTFPIFGRGWLARVDREEEEALQMIKNS